MIFRRWRETPTTRRNRVKKGEYSVGERQPHHIRAKSSSGPPFFGQTCRNVAIASSCGHATTPLPFGDAPMPRASIIASWRPFQRGRFSLELLNIHAPPQCWFFGLD